MQEIERAPPAARATLYFALLRARTTFPSLAWKNYATHAPADFGIQARRSASCARATYVLCLATRTHFILQATLSYSYHMACEHFPSYAVEKMLLSLRSNLCL